MGSMSLTDGKRSMRTVSAPRSTGPLVENTNIGNVGNRLRGSLQGNLGGSLRENLTEKPCGLDTLVYFDENPPKLLPVQPMTYGELYANTTTENEATENVENAKDDVEDEIEDDIDKTMEPVFLISSNGSIPSPPDAAASPAPLNAASESRNVVRRKLTGYVGFANLPNQWHRKSVRKGFNFNVMVVGESGLGKSTLVNTLFNTSLYPPKERKGPSLDIIPKTVTIQSISADIEEAGVRLRLTVVDTPGFGDFVNNDESWRPIVDNIEQRYDAYLDAENKVNRMNIVDNRIHACVFFIQPTGHSLKPLDIEVMKRLHTKVNLIPVIAKSDTLTDEEITAFKRRILADIQYHKVQIFEGPRYELDDEETIAENNEILSKVPFAVVGATNEITNADGRKVRGRRYPWGVIEVDNEEHCDFVKLRQMLIRTHMEELKENTNNILYENYRTDKLLQMGVSQDPSVFKEVNPAVKQEEERSLHDQKLAKMEAEMKLVFQQKVTEKESKLKQSEEELYARHREMKDQLERQRQELEEKKSRIESGRPLEKEGKRKGFSLR
ncbi:Cell division control protein 3 [Sporothrix epigloea]|uniref:Cell division control protein 3 n=1 Tax=Sporothrix epigloea TaxID=1892477 RepID=A0ABP0D4D8_9PEZI